MAWKLVESDTYRFDEEAAEKPITFIEKYLRHYEDPFTGSPFLLLDWQKEIARNLFGWLRRDNGWRRFQYLFLETAKGSGKSPFITALALYLFFGDKREGQQFFSIAANFEQANITFDAAKKMIAASPLLAERVNPLQYEILYPRRNSRWKLLSSEITGKQGSRPNVILADEIHEWESRKLYDNVKAGIPKRANSLMLMATNAGWGTTSVCYELHKKALDVLAGNDKDETFYPVVYAASKKDDISLPATWKKANPSLGITIPLSNVENYYRSAIGTPEEPTFRRFYCTQWTGAATKWIDLAQWDNAVGELPDDVAKLPLYMGVDLSKLDDLTAISYVWVGKERVYVRVRHYIPRATAFRYEDKDGVPFTKWAGKKHITLLDSATIDDDAFKRFEKLIVGAAAKYDLRAVCFDRYRAEVLMSRLEKRGLAVIPVNQKGADMGLAALDFDGRLKAGTVTLPKNKCLRWQAENVEIESDKYGNIYPVKEAASGRYSGRRGSKIDGIVAMLLALSRARKHEMFAEDANALSNWDGKVLFM